MREGDIGGVFDFNPSWHFNFRLRVIENNLLYNFGSYWTALPNPISRKNVTNFEILEDIHSKTGHQKLNET